MKKIREYTDELGRNMAEYIDDAGDHRVGPATPADEVCDFCLSERPRWVYPAGHVEILNHPVINVSDDPWGACDRCHDLIEAGEPDRLAEYVYETQRQLVATNSDLLLPPMDVVVPGFLDLFSRFTAARTGPAYLDEGYFSQFYEDQR